MRLYAILDSVFAPAPAAHIPDPLNLRRESSELSVHGNRNRAVAELMLNVCRTQVRHQRVGRIGVPEIRGVTNPQAGGLADPLNQALGLALAERIRACRLIRIFK